jgi:hypothetical protein
MFYHTLHHFLCNNLGFVGMFLVCLTFWREEREKKGQYPKGQYLNIWVYLLNMLGVPKYLFNMDKFENKRPHFFIHTISDEIEQFCALYIFSPSVCVYHTHM